MPPNSNRSAAACGFRMPAEWEPQEAVWLSWPHRESTWPGAFAPVPAVFAQIAREIAECELVRINVADETMATQVRQLLNATRVDLSQIRFHFNPTNDCWVRDHGPIYVINEHGERAITNWTYNSWGEKHPPFDLDNGIPDRIAAEFDERLFAGEMVLEGGSIDVNGRGTLLTSEACLLHPNRNPEMSRADIESRLADMLNVQHFLWLGDGIVGDDTDGHVDDITRFVGETAVVTALEANPDDSNYRPLKENRERLQSFTDQQGRRLTVHELPMPDPVYFAEERLPASYANFLIVNEKVIVPTYRSRHDALALEILQELFPDRKVVGIDCTDLIWGLGSIHCVTQQQPVTSTQRIESQ